MAELCLLLWPLHPAIVALETIWLRCTHLWLIISALTYPLLAKNSSLKTRRLEVEVRVHLKTDSSGKSKAPEHREISTAPCPAEGATRNLPVHCTSPTSSPRTAVFVKGNAQAINYTGGTEDRQTFCSLLDGFGSTDHQLGGFEDYLGLRIHIQNETSPSNDTQFKKKKTNYEKEVALCNSWRHI